MSVRHLGDGNAKEVYRSWDFVNNTAIRFHGSSDVPASNIAMDFVAYLVEFTATSEMVKQNGTLIVDGADVNKEFVTTLSPIVNTTNSFFTFDGLNMDHSDLTWGSEEFAIMRVLNNTTWGYEPTDAPNSGNTEVRFSVIDWNNPAFVIQNGTGSLLETESLDTIVPSPSIIRNQTMILVTTSLQDDLDSSSDEHGATATINASNEIEIRRDDAICPVPAQDCQVNYRYELISFPSTFALVIHDEVDDIVATASDVTDTTDDIFSPAVTNFANSIAIGTVQTPFGLGNARDSSGSAGTWDRSSYTIELLNNTAVRAITNDGENTPNMPYQVIEFLAIGGAVFNQDVLDLVTAVDLSQDKIVTKVASDIAGTADTVSTGVIFVVNLDDTGTVTDVTSINVSKLAQDAVSVGDDPEFVITKLLTDSSIISDNVITSITKDVSILDTATVNDLVIFNVTKQFQDVATGIDNVNIETTKIFLDTTSVVDTTDASLEAGVNATDTSTVLDTIIFNATKAFEDISNISDDVILLRTIDLLVNDTISVNDPSILFKITTAVQGTGGGGGGTPTPQFERIVGLFVESELIALQTTDRINSDFKIQWFGQDRSLTSITKISTEPEFASWLQFSPTPDLLQVQQTIDGSRTINDPARFVNFALDDFLVIAPSISCDQVDRFDALTTPCLDPILYQVPVEFEFTKSGVKFHADHILMIDGRVAVPVCNFFGFDMPQGTCEVAQFGIDNWIWFIIIFGVLYFTFLLIPRLTGKTRNVRRAGSRELESMSDRKVKRKFKRGKR